MAAQRSDFPVAPAIGIGAQHRDIEAARIALRRQECERTLAGAVGIDLERTGSGKRVRRCLGRAVLDAVAQPDDLRPVRKLRPRDGGRCAHAVGQPGLGRQRLRDACRFSGIHQAHIRNVGGRYDGHRTALAARAAQNVCNHGFSRIPVRGGGPAIVDEENHRTCSGNRRRLADQGIGQRDDQTGRRDQAKQQQPPGRLRRRFFVAGKAQQQAQRRKDDAAGQRGRDAQQPPDRRQDKQSRENPRRAEAQSREEFHGSTRRSYRHRARSARSAANDPCGARYRSSPGGAPIRRLRRHAP